jgi:hypothetical protein
VNRFHHHHAGRKSELLRLSDPVAIRELHTAQGKSGSLLDFCEHPHSDTHGFEGCALGFDQFPICLVDPELCVQLPEHPRAHVLRLVS